MNNNTQKKRRRIKLIIKIADLIVISFCIFCLRYDIYTIYNKKFPPKKIDTFELSTNEKLEDFEFVYNTVKSSMPMIKDYNELYGINFVERKEYYQSLIEKTDTNFEFYCTMQAILQDIPSFHTDLVYPRIDTIKRMHCYNSKESAANRDVIQKNSYWSSIIDENVKSKKNTKYCVFEYIDGKYISNISENTINSGKKLSLISVNDINIDEYAIKQVFTSSLHFDGKNEKPYRTRFIFCNDDTAEKVHLKLKDEKGNIIEQSLFFSLENEEIYYNSKENSLSEQKNYTYYENDIASYIKIDFMESISGNEITSAISNLKNENIIVDLRDNRGGDTRFASKYIYPSLYKDDIKVTNMWYMPKSSENKKIISNIFNRIVLSLKKTYNAPYNVENEEMLCSKLTVKYKGQAKNNKNIIILTSSQTGSAADKFVNDMKYNKKALIIGNNTGGEGLMNSFNMSIIPNSCLTFIYMPSGAKNPDGNDNSVYGTQPDIYVNLTEEDYYLYNNMIINKEDVSSFESNLKYDTILKYCMNYLKEH